MFPGVGGSFVVGNFGGHGKRVVVSDEDTLIWVVGDLGS